jgi:hypothetical protein
MSDVPSSTGAPARREIVVFIVRRDTTQLVSVIGDSPLERFWVAEARQAWQPYTNRLQITWLNELPFPETCRRVATLPPRSVVGYGLLLVDAAGVPHERMEKLDQLCAAANAPVFGMAEEQLGHGIIGGWLISGATQGREAAKAAVRILRGESPGSLPIPVIRAAPMFDWRELQRWHVDESRLPPGSIVKFRQPSVWQQYRWLILGAMAIILAQAATITGPLLQRLWRHRAERAARLATLNLGAQQTAALKQMHGKVPTSVANMNPRNPFLGALHDLPLAAGITAHSIIAVEGNGPAETGNDGVVAYTSAHIAGVESEYIVRSPHDCLNQPLAIEELRRILLKHLISSGK